MATHYRFAQRGCFHWTYIAPAHILSDDRVKDEDGNVLPGLREVASSDGRCYLRVLRPLSCSTFYRVEVAACTNQLHSDPFLVILTEEQLAYALPLDVRMEAKSQEQFRARVKAHAMAAQLLQRREAPEVPSLTQGPVEVPLLVSEVVEVPEEAVQEALGLAMGAPAFSRNEKSDSVQQGLLTLVIDMLMAQFHRREHEAFCPIQSRRLKARTLLLNKLAQWQEHTHQRVVNALSVVNEAGEKVWRLIIGAPHPLCWQHK